MGSIYPDTRDQRRLYNSNNKTLLQNWAEERAAEELDKTANIKNSHRGILSINDSAPMNKKSTYKDNYYEKDVSQIEESRKGVRQKLTEQMLMRKLEEQIENDEFLNNDWSDEPTNFVSETHEKYFIPGFVSQDPKPITKHDVYSEMPISFWSDKRSRITGVTASNKALDTPFRRNAAFSRPINESYDQAKPYELENYPNQTQNSYSYAPIM